MRSPRRRVLPGTPFLLYGLLVLLLCSAAPMSAKAQLVPPWRLKDEVGVISDAGRRDIIQRISLFELHTKRQFAVWIKAELPESEVDDLVAGKFQQWALGNPETQLGGMLLTVSVGDRSAYVAVNYDLDSLITNEISQRIVRETIDPALEQHAYEDAVDNGLIALMVQAAGHGPWENPGTRHPIEDIEAGQSFGSHCHGQRGHRRTVPQIALHVARLFVLRLGNRCRNVDRCLPAR